MKTIKTLDIWTEQYPNHYECFNGAFMDGMDKGLAYTSIKVVKNCNCIISNNLNLSIGNKHNAIVFYGANGGGNKPVRLLVADKNTDIDKCINNAINQSVGNVKLKDLFSIKNISIIIVNLKQKPNDNEYNGKREIDIGSCDRLLLLQNMLQGDYTESDSSFGNYDCNDYDYISYGEVKYDLVTDEEHFVIDHRGVYLNKIKTRAIIIQRDSELGKTYR